MVFIIMKEVYLYTDGACLGNPGPGGYGLILKYQEHEKEYSKGFKLTTNNRMELKAAIEGLSLLKEPCKVSIFTDSQYVKNGITQWLEGWKLKNWHTKGKTPVKNKDLWQQLDQLCQIHQTTWFWVKGHAGHPQNERCDKLAVMAANSDDKVIDTGFLSDVKQPTT